MKNLLVKDCLQTDKLLHVSEEQRPSSAEGDVVFAIFSETTEPSQFCGLVTTYDISLHPNWIFADLCKSSPPVSVTPDTDIEQTVALMQQYDRDVLPVFENHQLLGIVTRKHILETLLSQEQKLLTESTQLHQQLEIEHQQTLSKSNRIAQLYDASKNLLANLAHTSIKFETIQTGVDALSKLLQCEQVAVGILDRDNKLEQFIYSGLTSKQAKKIGQWLNSSNIINTLDDKSASLMFSDIQNQVNCVDLHALELDITSLLAVPLIIQNYLYGHVYVANKNAGEAFDNDDEVLVRSFAHSLSLALDNTRKQEEVAQAKQHLDYITYFDPLTNLPNRTQLTKELVQAVTDAQQHGSSLAVLFINVDGFKTINDSLGHQAGDQLLKQLAQRLNSILSPSDTAARFASDEFVILLPTGDNKQATNIAEAVISALQSPFSIIKYEVFASVSIGIALSQDNANSVEKILSNAGAALHHAKSLGKNQYRFFNDEMKTTVHDHFELERHLRHAIDNNELELFYQPKIDIKSGDTVGFEALLRWHSAEYGAVPPSTFITLAEDSGLIISIGAWVIQQACHQAKQWLEQGYPASVSVNLSGRQFHHIGNQQNTLYQVVTDALQASELPAEMLELEITENIMMHHLNESLKTLEKLKALGVKISIDDFGTGYSSLSYIKKFPIDSLKIDKSFIEDLVTDPNDAAIVSTIITMAQQLNLDVVVEGIETEEQLAFFKENDHAVVLQGYYFCRPVPEDQIRYIFSD